jgi:hypothetical protein
VRHVGPNITTKKSRTMQFEFDSSAANGLGPDGNIQAITTSHVAGYALTPGNSSTAGTDTLNYDPLARVTADTETGPSGTSNSTSETYNDNGEATQENDSVGNSAVTYPSTGADSGAISSVSSSGRTRSPWKDTGYDGDGNVSRLVRQRLCALVTLQMVPNRDRPSTRLPRPIRRRRLFVCNADACVL